MSWFKKIEKIDVMMPHAAQQDFQIVGIQAPTFKMPDNLKNDIVLQWIVYPFLLGIDGVCFQVPIYSNKMHDYLLDFILCHFSNIQGIYENENMTMIRLNELHSESGQVFKNHLLKSQSISPIVKEFYMKTKLQMPFNNRFDIQNIEINIEDFRKRLIIPEDHINNSSELWNFFQDTHISKEGSIIISPRNWILNDSLLSSPTLEYFSRFAKKIILTVNNNNLYIRAIGLS